MRSMFVRAIVFGGIIGGTLDIIAAIVLLGFRGSTPMQVLQSVASGLLGMNAYDGGILSALLGLALHFFIALSAAFVYCVLKTKIVFPRSLILSGLIYGIAVYSFMNFVVLPLSAFPHAIRYTLRGLIVIMFCVGLPISFAARRITVPDAEC